MSRPAATSGQEDALTDLLKAKTSEGAQEMSARENTTARELRSEVGGVSGPRTRPLTGC